MPTVTSETRQDTVDDLSHGYIEIVEPSEHGNVLTMDLVKSASRNFTKPVVFRKLVPLGPRVATREFVDIESEQKLLWRERTGDAAVAFRNDAGKTDYNYVSGREGTAREFLDEIFVHKKDVYAHLGYVSSGFSDLHKFPWGATVFDHVKEEVFREAWYQIPQWDLSGHAFVGNNTEMYAEPSSGAPGSDWHMFPTANIFVLVAGKKKWMTYPPQPGDQFRNYEELIYPTGGREGPIEDRPYDTVYLEAGDVLFNVPFEWHKVVNATGWSLGSAYRVVDQPYVDSFLAGPANTSNPDLKKLGVEYAHLATSINVASHDPVRMQMSLNTVEMILCAIGRFPFIR